MTHFLVIVLAFAIRAASGQDDKYYGNYIGDFVDRFHGVKGQVYAVDSRTLFIKGFEYDGQGPDAYFYAGAGADYASGFLVPNEKGSTDVLRSYDGSKDLVLTLPSGKTLKGVEWISVWCRAFDVNFGEVNFPVGFAYPRPQKIDAFKGIHDVSSSRIIIVDAQTLLIPSFSYDGSAPDAHFHVGKGGQVGPAGSTVPDENGSLDPLRRYQDKTLVLVLPNDLTIFDIDWISVWCVDFFVDFGHVNIPKGLNVPPSLKMLGIAPQTHLNCEVLDKDKSFEVRWAIAGKSIVTQLVAKLSDKEYMGFGLSGNPDRSQMVGGDVTVAWMDHITGQGYAEDYYLDAKSQCAGGRGSCPDSNIPGGKNKVRLLNSAIINDFTMMTYRLPLRGNDRFDQQILTNDTQSVIWAIGPVNSKGEVSYHSKRIRGDLKLDFGRIPQWNCPLAGQKGRKGQAKRPNRPQQPRAPKSKSPWVIPPVRCHEPDDGVFFAQIGPTGGEQGYSAITGRVGWGIAWYINGLLIPEIHVVRGKTYTFVIEGGLDPNQPAAYHPFYISDDAEGGFQHKSLAEQNKVKIMAGVKREGRGYSPTGTGRLCEWKEDPSEPAELSRSFGAYQRTLSLQCQKGQPGILQWTPDRNTPDTVYYQCYTHRHLGWKIHVVDSCDTS